MSIQKHRSADNLRLSHSQAQLQPPPPFSVPLSWFRLLAMMHLPCMSLAQDVRYIYHKLLFAVVSAVGHVANRIFQQNLSAKFLCKRAKSCRFPWPFAFQWLGWPTVNPRMTFTNNLSFRLFVFCLTVLNEHEYDNIRPCRKVLIMLFGLSWVLWSSLTQRLHRDLGSVDERDRVRRSEISLLKIFRELRLVIKEVKTEYFYSSWNFEAETFWLHLLPNCVYNVDFYTRPHLLSESQVWCCWFQHEQLMTWREVQRINPGERARRRWPKSSMTKNFITGRDVLSPLTFCNLAADAKKY